MQAFKRNLLIGFGLSLLLLVVSSVASYVSIRNLLTITDQVNYTNDVMSKLEGVISALKDAETGQRGFLLTGEDAFLEPYQGAYSRSLSQLAEVKQLTKENPEQQVDVEMLRNVIVKRLSKLQALINQKRAGDSIRTEQLLEGKTYMDDARRIVLAMQAREQALLSGKTDTQKNFATYTPILILIAASLSIIITVVSFGRVLTDFNKRAAMQQELQKKDEEISNRLTIIRGIADTISGGDYKSRVSDDKQDALGGIAGSLNRMAESLDYSFTNLSEKEWLQTGIAQLNESMIGEKNLEALTEKVLSFIAEYSDAAIGAFYLMKNEKTLILASGIGLDKSRMHTEARVGEGLAGQAAAARKQVVLDDLSETEFVVNFSGGQIKPKFVVAIPVFYEGILKGVCELGFLQSPKNITLDFLRLSVFNIGMAIHSAKDHQRLQELLHETQAQSEELQSQHTELENINAELEAQAEKLQASEEELRVQQEELQQANQELEERSRLLEEKNELILERNLQIQSKAEELEISTKYKSEFLANMSHELRTPLNSILLLSRLLAENQHGNLSKDQVEYASVIQSSGNGLLRLIDEILDLSKIESGKMELEYNDVKLDNIVNDVRMMFEPLAKDKGIYFKIEVKDAPEFFETDKLRVEQIIRNLISNALKFTKKGGVTLSISKSTDTIVFSVKDTGIGIPKEKQQTIFEAFQQADGSTRRQFGGTGLGLSISRELAKLLGGEIKIESEEGKGSEFTLLLPIKKKLAASRSEWRGEEANQYTRQEEEKQYYADSFIANVIPASIPDDRSSITAGDKIILIIDDDTGFARFLLDYTRSKGYKGIVAVRGDEGIQLAKQFRPVGILLDLQLPVKSGWQVMEELKSDNATRAIPVHIMSSHEAKTKSLSKGAVDFINKPVAFEQLTEIFQKIEHALSRHPRKVLIVEENTKHAQALTFFLETYNINAEIRQNVGEGISALNRDEVDCVVLDMGVPAQHSYDMLEQVKKTPGLENLPIIIFTGKNLSHVEEMRIKQYADSIVIKTAHSYQRLLDEVSLFLHLVEENTKDAKVPRYKKAGEVLKDKTVLVADDDVRNIFSLTKSLETYGMNVVSAVDGQEALNQLSKHDDTDIVLMDMMMPEMDGYESIRQIRQNPKYKKLPIIAITAKAMMGDREKCIAAGASDYITKPVDVDQLISLLRVWLYE